MGYNHTFESSYGDKKEAFLGKRIRDGITRSDLTLDRIISWSAGTYSTEDMAQRKKRKENK